MSRLGPDGSALETQAMEDQSLSKVVKSLANSSRTSAGSSATAADEPAGGAAAAMEVGSLADGTDNPS